MTRKSDCLIIAEAGVNHNGSLAEAIRLVDAAKSAGADIVKFQTFKAENLVTRTAKRAEYQIRQTGSSDSQFDMLKKLELSFDDFLAIADYCDRVKIEFLSTAFDDECLDFLVSRAGIKRIKIPSGEITNGPLIAASAKTKLPIIMSTGMSTISEIENALDIIVWARIDQTGNYVGQFRSSHSKDLPVHILHCTTEYPAPFNELNLMAIPQMAKAFGLPVGYSDHSEGIVAPVAATALGATMIEKHFTLSKTLPGPDHKASLEPLELCEMVRQIRVVEATLGSGFKEPTNSELANAKVARKSLIASRNIRQGELMSQDNITVKRPGTGMSPMLYWELLGKAASRPYLTDELILEDLKL